MSDYTVQYILPDVYTVSYAPTVFEIDVSPAIDKAGLDAHFVNANAHSLTANISAALTAAASPSASNPYSTRNFSINVADYGASPAASATTNRAAIQAAIDACPQFGRVVIPGKTYNIDATLTISSNSVTLFGDGMAMLVLYGSGNVLEVSGSSITIENIFVTTNSNSNAGCGIFATNSPSLRLTNVIVSGVQYHACSIANTWEVLTTNCGFDSSHSDAGYASFYHGVQSNAIVHIRTGFRSSGTTICADVVRGTAVNFEGCAIQGPASGNGIGIRTDDAQAVNINGCYFEGNSIGIQIGNANKTLAVNISGNYWYVTVANEIAVSIKACKSTTIRGNSFYGTAPSGSVGVLVDGTTALATNIEIANDNIFFGVETGVSDAAGRAVNWCELSSFAQRRIDFRSAVPKDGDVWAEGSIIINTDITDGKPIGWIADSTTAAVKEAWVTGHAYTVGDFVSNNINVYRAATSGTAGATPPVHTSGTVSDGGVDFLYVSNSAYATRPNYFYPFGQVGVRQGAGSPDGVITPNFIGETYIDYTVPDIYMSFNTNINGWKKIT